MKPMYLCACVSALSYDCLIEPVGVAWCRRAPLRSGVLAVEWVLELDDMAVPLTQQILLLGVILHQLGQRGELLASVQVVVIARVLDLDVRHLIVAPE